MFLSTLLAASRFCFKSEFVASSTQWFSLDFWMLLDDVSILKLGCS